MTDRNDPCPCGSGKKFKKCHGAKGDAAAPAKADAKASAATPSRSKPTGAAVAKESEAGSAGTSPDTGDAAQPLHTHKAANPAKDDSARKRHLQRRTDSPALRGSLFYKLKD